MSRPESPPPGRGAVGRWLRRLAVAVLLLLCVAFAERGVRALTARFLLPTGQAQWIWAAGPPSEETPASFYLVRELVLPDKPESADLLVQADEEYVAFLNGRGVGGRRYRPGAPLDAYRVGWMLRRGLNRLVVEVRSSRGLGGLLLALDVEGPDGRIRLVSDGEWGVVRRHSRDLFRLGVPLEGVEPVHVWGRPPVGRWTLPRVEGTTPVYADLRRGMHPIAAQRVRISRGSKVWRPIGGSSRRSPALGRWVTFDWGREVTGILALRFKDEAPLGVIYYGEAPEMPEEVRADAYLIGMPGARSWGATEVRTFRYATVIATGRLSGAHVLPLTPKLHDAVEIVDGKPDGVFGLPPLAALKPPLENEVWSELQRLAGDAGREEG